MKKESMSMSNYRVAENVTENKELEEQLRGSISAWAGEFREEYADFGRQIEIDKIGYMPTHAAAFQGYYEHRKAEYADRPLSNDDRVEGQPTITSPGGVNPWDYKMDSLPDTWDGQSSSIVLTDSKHIEKCHNCGGHGNNRCYDCRGEGTRECKTCEGKGTVYCTHCHGKGKLTCKVCNGRKYTESRDMYGNIVRTSCSSCGGTGKKQCHICGGEGTWTCKDCDGEGTVQCSTCRGEGTLVCNTCKGKGKMLKYIRVVQKFLPHTIIRSYNHSEVNRCFPEFDFDTSTPGDVLAEIEAERLDDGYLEGIFDPEGLKLKDFRQDLEEAHRKLDSECPEGTLASSTLSRRQKFMLIQVPVYFVEYRYKGKEFSLLAWGPDGEKVHAENSPFHHERYDYFTRGKELFDNKKYGEAMTCFEEALKVNEDEEVKQTLEETIQWIIGVLPKQYLKGIRSGGLLGAAIFVLFILLVPGSSRLVTSEKVMEYYAREGYAGIYLTGTLAGLTALATLVFARRRRKAFQRTDRKIIRSDSRRFKIGLVNGLACAAVAAVLVLALNYFGVLAPVVRTFGMLGGMIQNPPL